MASRVAAASAGVAAHTLLQSMGLRRSLRMAESLPSRVTLAVTPAHHRWAAATPLGTAASDAATSHRRGAEQHLTAMLSAALPLGFPMEADVMCDPTPALGDDDAVDGLGFFDDAPYQPGATPVAIHAMNRNAREPQKVWRSAAADRQT